jgi:hypothetical protein
MSLKRLDEQGAFARIRATRYNEADLFRRFHRLASHSELDRALRRSQADHPSVARNALPLGHLGGAMPGLPSLPYIAAALIEDEGTSDNQRKH